MKWGCREFLSCPLDSSLVVEVILSSDIGKTSIFTMSSVSLKREWRLRLTQFDDLCLKGCRGYDSRADFAIHRGRHHSEKQLCS